MGLGGGIAWGPCGWIPWDPQKWVLADPPPGSRSLGNLGAGPPLRGGGRGIPQDLVPCALGGPWVRVPPLLAQPVTPT